MKNAIFWDVVRTDVSEARGASIIRITRVGELEMLATLKRRFLQEPHGTKSQKTAFFIVTAVKNSILHNPSYGPDTIAKTL
jgi:hypothetical protein